MAFIREVVQSWQCMFLKHGCPYTCNIFWIVCIYIYWAKVLTDHPKNCGNFFVAEYFGMTCGTLNFDTI